MLASLVRRPKAGRKGQTSGRSGWRRSQGWRGSRATRCRWPLATSLSLGFSWSPFSRCSRRNGPGYCRLIASCLLQQELPEGGHLGTLQRLALVDEVEAVAFRDRKIEGRDKAPFGDQAGGDAARFEGQALAADDGLDHGVLIVEDHAAPGQCRVEPGDDQPLAPVLM